MGKVRNSEDLQWIKVVLQGDTEAFRHLVVRYKDFVYSLTVNLLKQKEEAEEAAQDVFLKAFRGLPRFRHDAMFSTWLYRIAYNECVTRLRKRKTKLPLAADFNEMQLAGKTEPEEIQWQQREEQYKLLHDAIRELPETDRALVMLFYFEKLPVEEMSFVTGLSVSNVKTKLFRARKKLYDKMVHIDEEVVSRKGESEK